MFQRINHPYCRGAVVLNCTAELPIPVIDYNPALNRQDMFGSVLVDVNYCCCCVYYLVVASSFAYCQHASSTKMVVAVVPQLASKDTVVAERYLPC